MPYMSPTREGLLLYIPASKCGMNASGDLACRHTAAKHIYKHVIIVVQNIII